MMSSTKPLFLHAHSTGPNPMKVAILLEILHVPYTVKLWEFGDDPKSGVKGATFLAINENGRVPALEDPNTGVLAWESGAIIDYILRVYDTANKLHLGADASEQGKVDFDKWVYFLVSTLAPMTGQCNWFRHYHPTKNEDALKRYQEQAYRTYSVLEGQLKKSGGDTILGGKFSAVDAHFYPWVDEWEFAGLSLEDYPLVKSWYEKTKQSSVVQSAYSKVSAGESA